MSPKILSFVFSVLTAASIALVVQYHLHGHSAATSPRKFMILDEQIVYAEHEYAAELTAKSKD
ncbi:hypothetical protein SAMN02745866_01624 [Alteromonadaceae bacterium Bs31]|nr:hypothetical protein SAMN02745866_01624 [Alteromonadaceae bacterium Bs31]